LPDQVDTGRDGGLLEKCGLNPVDLIARFTGGDGGAAWAACSARSSDIGSRRSAIPSTQFDF
jgi:hypothetical protein